MKFEINKKYSWDDLLNSNINEINLFGYGSLMNHYSHNYKVKLLEKGYVEGFKRIYNINHPIDFIESRDLRYYKISKLLNEDYLQPFNRMSLSFRGGLNIIKENASKTNGVVLKIQKKDFKELAIRESIYDLYFKEFITENNQIIHTLVLVAPKKILETNVKPYYLYVKSCRNGAYLISENFGLEFDKTSFMEDGKTLAINWFIDNYFSIGTKVKIINSLFSMKNECIWELTKNINSIGVIKEIW